MLTVKAKHATMLLTVSEVDGLSDGMDELSDEELPCAVATAAAAAKQLPAHPSVVMVSGKAPYLATCTTTQRLTHAHTAQLCTCVASAPLFLVFKSKWKIRAVPGAFFGFQRVCAGCFVIV